MDHVEVFVADDRLGAILETLDGLDVSYAVTAGGGPHEDRSMVSFAVPSDGVEEVLDELRDAGLEEDALVVVTGPEIARSPTEDALRDRYARTGGRFEQAALDSKVWDMRRGTRTFLVLMALSAGIATVGLVTDTPAIVVGAMVITPLLTPVLSVGVGAAVGDGQMVREGVTSQLAGLATAALVGAAIGLVARAIDLLPDALAVAELPLVTVRVAPGLLPFAVGTFAGVAAGLGLANKEFVLLAGVAIAGALLPTAAAVGLGIAWAHRPLALGAAVLVLQSVIAINVAAAATLLVLGYRPEAPDLSLPSGGRAAAWLVAGTVLTALVLGVAVGSVQQTSFERTAAEQTDAALADPSYDGLRVVQVDAEYAGLGTTAEPHAVTVEVSRPADAQHPPLAEALRQRLAEHGYEVEVRVEYRDQERARPSG